MATPTNPKPPLFGAVGARPVHNQDQEMATSGPRRTTPIADLDAYLDVTGGWTPDDPPETIIQSGRSKTPTPDSMTQQS